MTVVATIETGDSSRFWCRLSLPLVIGSEKRFWLSAPSRSDQFFLSSLSFLETSALSTFGCCPPISSLVWFSLFLTLLLPRKIFFEDLWWSWDVLPFYLEMYPCHVSLRPLPFYLVSLSSQAFIGPSRLLNSSFYSWFGLARNTIFLLHLIFVGWDFIYLF